MLQPKSPTYALIAVTAVAQRQTSGGELVQTGDLAKTFNIPYAYLARILGLLAGAGILRSKRGPRGGFCMGRPTGKITVLDVIDAIDTRKDWAGALPPVRIPRKLRQEMTAAFGRAGEAARKSLANVTIDQLLGGGKQKSK